MQPITGTITDPAVTRAMRSLPDVLITREGGLFLVKGVSRKGNAWIEENVYQDEETQHWAGAIVVEHRYIDGLFDGMVDSGLVVR